MINIKGNTFEHRDYLKSIGARWSKHNNSWVVTSLSAHRRQHLESLTGIILVDEKKKAPSGVFPLPMFPKPFKRDNKETIVCGDDQTYLGYFRDQNPIVYFGFSSMVEFADYVEKMPDKFKEGDRGAGWETDKPKWAGTANMKEAIDLVYNGWERGASFAEKVIEEISVEHAKKSKRISSLAGGSVNVGKLLSGNPKHMIRRNKRKGTKAYTIFVECVVTAMTDTETTKLKTAAVGAMIDMMEQQGYSCEVNAVGSISYAKQPAVQVCVNLKQAGEKFNVRDLVFALGHPSFLRRLVFALIGSRDECREIWDTMGQPSRAFSGLHPTKENEFYFSELSSFVTEAVDEVDGSKAKALKILEMIKPYDLEMTRRGTS